MEDDRLNSPNTSAVKIEVLGHQLQFSQDPNSKHLGTTVWDASMVFVKFLERNCRKGRFCPAKMKGKRAIELGAGCGLAGFGMSLLGCDVVSTDQVEVLPLLMRNVERNTSRIMQTNYDTGSFGSIEVAELDWGNLEQIKAVNPPFDYIIGTDVVYAEHLLEPLLQTIFSLSGPRTTIMLGYEIRSTTVHKQMMDMWKSNFEVKTIPRTKMDPRYQHASIQLFLMGLKNQVGPPQKKILGEADGRTSKQESGDEICESPAGSPHCSGDEILNEEYLEVENGKPDEWETRRIGSLAARLLRDVKIK